MCLSGWDGIIFNHSWLRHSWLKIIPSRPLRHIRDTTRQGNPYHHSCYARNVPYSVESYCVIKQNPAGFCHKKVHKNGPFTAKRKLERLLFSTSSLFVKIWSACSCKFKAYFWTFWALYNLFFDLETIRVN